MRPRRKQRRTERMSKAKYSKFKKRTKSPYAAVMKLHRLGKHPLEIARTTGLDLSYVLNCIEYSQGGAVKKNAKR